MRPRIADSSTDARLSGLEAFLEFWFGPRRPEYGEPADVLATIELPAALRRFYGFGGRWPPPDLRYATNRFRFQDRFLPLQRCDWGNAYRAGPYFVFVAENQGVWEVATLAHGEDPRVWVSEDCSHRTPHPRWRPLAEPLSHFLVTFVLQECIFGAEERACVENALAVFENAGCAIEPIWMNGEFAWPDVRHSYLLIDNKILVRRDTGDVALADHWYGYNDPAAGELLCRLNLPTTLR
jgi:hypothetical protein